MTASELVSLAASALDHAYAPYSQFRVGAALEAKSGRVYTGVNVESVSYGGTICAERSALVAAVSAGEHEFVRIAVVSDALDFTMPCGICRQMLVEFGDMEVICAKPDGDCRCFKLSELLPHTFEK